MMRCYCFKCNNFFTTDDMDFCPICDASIDSLEECSDLDDFIEEEEENFDFDAYDEYMRNEGEVLDALKINRVR